MIAIELDRDLVPYLRDRYREAGNVDVIERDVLDVNLGEVAGSEFLLAGNVPYYITTPILFHALEPPRPARAVYLVQREVAERIVAPPGSRTYGALSVNVQAVARAELVGRVPAGAFRPPPSVESAIVRLTPRPTRSWTSHSRRAFRSLVQDAFGLRRKQNASGRADDRAPRRRRRGSGARGGGDRPGGASGDAVAGGLRSTCFARSTDDRRQRSRFVSANDNPSSSIAMFTFLSVTSGGTCN